MEQKLLTIAISAAKKAGAVLKKRFPYIHESRWKKDESPVSAVDEEAEHIILGILKKRFPGHSFVAEEGGPDMQKSDYVWYIDPLDGSRNFLNHVPWFSVSIGCVKNGVPIVGVVFDPLRNELFSARRGGGAFLNGKRISVMTPRPLLKMIIGSSRGPFTKRQHSRLYVRLDASSGGVRPLGSTALILAYIAAGRFGAAFSCGVQIHDVAAGLLIAKEAGAEILTLQGKPASFDSLTCIAAHRHIARQMVKIIQNTR